MARMRLNEARRTVEERIEPPVSVEDLRESCGDIEIDCPDGEPTTFTEVLEMDDERSYDCVTEIHESLMSNLPDSHVGRKKYDDRGPNYGTDEVSF